MSTTRSLRNRSSRYSSPATFAENHAPPKPVEPQRSQDARQTSLDKWVEPSVRNAVPSFEDTKGLERVGVLEHMAPLGVPPSQKLLQKLKVSLKPGQSLRVLPISSEEVTPTVEPRTEVASPVDIEPLPESNRAEEPIKISSPPRGRPAKKELNEMRQIIDITTPSPVKTTFQSVQASPKPQSIQEILRQDRMKNVFDRAIAEAKNQSDLKVVPGLQRMFEDARSNPQLWTTLDAVLNRSPTDAQFKIFKRYIKRGIKHYRKHSADLQYSPHLASNNNMSPQSRPVGYLHTFPSHSTSAGPVLPNSHPVNSPFRFKPVNIPPVSPVNQATMSPIKPGASFAETELQSSPSQKRSRSVSSSSSLSSAKSMPEDYSPEAIEIDAESQAAEGRPVRLTGQRQATNKVAAGSRTRSSAAPQPELSQSFSGFPTTIKFVSKKLKTAHKRDDSVFDSEKVDAKRHELEHDTFDYNNIQNPQSDERTVVEGSIVKDSSPVTSVPPPVIHPHSLLLSAVALLSPPETQGRPELSLPNGTSRKRPYDEIDKDDIDVITPLSSSPAPTFAPPPPPAAAGTLTRGATPRSARFPPPTKARKSARVMVSPNKPKNGGITAGISRAGPGRDSMIGNGAESGAEDNDEFCASCGGEGTLLCCDGCTNSFHHGCLEPPLNPDDEVDGEWFCPRCIARRNKDLLPATGLMGQIIRRVDHTIPKAFSLPFEIRDYFEGVKTGEEGEYEEVGLPRAQNTGAKMNRAGFFEEPSYKELRDSKGNFILCYRCGKASNGRDIVPCDYCPAKWHTDCVDPPLAVPPRRRGGDKPTGYWRCPLHTEGDFAEIGRQAGAAPGDLGRIPRLRKPKKPILIDIDLSRGFRNNGIIEVELMKDEPMPDIRERVMDHGIYRIHEKGIRLDFIDRVKKSWYEDHVFPRQLNAQPRIRHRIYRPDDPVLYQPETYTVLERKGSKSNSTPGANSLPPVVQLQQKSTSEQAAIMGLLGMSDQVDDDDLNDLANTLVADTSNDHDTTPAMEILSRNTLQQLQKLISDRLAILDDRHQQRKPDQLGRRADSNEGSRLVNGGTVKAEETSEHQEQPSIEKADSVQINGGNDHSGEAGGGDPMDADARSGANADMNGDGDRAQDEEDAQIA